MDLSTREINRIKETLELIPPGIISILEVGCGDGRITNTISCKYRITGIDIDSEKIKTFQGLKIIADSSRLPFKEEKFDLVLAAEILEHLEGKVFFHTLEEIYRVVKKYILITVPFKEALPAVQAKCSSCGNIFHAWGHKRKFNLSASKNLFPNTRLIKRRLMGREAKIPSWLYIITQRFGNVYYFDNKAAPNYCPKCNRQLLKNEGNLLGWFLIRIIWHLEKMDFFKKPVWIGCLYKK